MPGTAGRAHRRFLKAQTPRSGPWSPLRGGDPRKGKKRREMNTRREGKRRECKGNWKERNGERERTGKERGREEGWVDTPNV